MPRRLLAALSLSVCALALSSQAEAVTDDGPKRAADFINAVFSRLPASLNQDFTPIFWQTAGNPTKEGVGVLRTSGADVDELARLVMDVDHYVGNLDHVAECRMVPDTRFKPPISVRFYQHVKLPVIKDVQHELVLNDGGTRDGWRVLYWYHLGPETTKLLPSNGARSDYSVGVWLLRPDAVGYGLSNAPTLADLDVVSKYALTTGADSQAPDIVRNNIEGLLAWAARTP